MLRNNTTPSIDYVLIDAWREAERTSLERLLDESVHTQIFQVEHKIIGYHQDEWNKDTNYQEHVMESMKRQIMEDVQDMLDKAGCFSVDEISTPYYLDGGIRMRLDLSLLKDPRKFKDQMKEAIKELTDGIEDL